MKSPSCNPMTPYPNSKHVFLCVLWNHYQRTTKKSNDSLDCLLMRIPSVISMLSDLLHFVMVVHNKYIGGFVTFTIGIGDHLCNNCTSTFNIGQTNGNGKRTHNGATWKYFSVDFTRKQPSNDWSLCVGGCACGSYCCQRYLSHGVTHVLH